MTRFSWTLLALSLILTLAPAPIAHAADCTSGARILAGITFERLCAGGIDTAAPPSSRSLIPPRQSKVAASNGETANFFGGFLN